MNSIEIISKVSSKNLSQEETAHIMQEIFLGKISEQEIENFLLSLSEKGETSDELTGGYDVIKGSKIKIEGYLEDFALSKDEADALIMSARSIVYKD